MNIFKKIFGSKTPTANSSQQTAPHERVQAIQLATNQLWKLIEETMAYYNSISCQCAFPRFYQYTSIDCVDYRGSFYMSETEGFIYHARPYFEIIEAQSGQEASMSMYTCKKCGSTFDFGWSDFSIHVNRSFLKQRELKAQQLGVAIKTPIPFVVGLFGHKLADRSLFEKVDLETFRHYVQEKL